MSAHLGRRVSDLLDGQLSATETEAAWSHVHTCHQCRDDVEREGWVKTRLSTLALDVDDSRCAPDRLKGALLGMPPGDCYLRPSGPGMFAHHDGLSNGDHTGAHRPRARRTAGMAALGGGAVGAAVLGVLALGTAPADAPSFDRRYQPVPASPVSSPNPSPARLPVRLPSRLPG
ncbi:hypothetical protein [Nocardioides sp. 1609]|uniref:hypothetical protein n=1 Tax=Nocardioides sp. 1609 TaxID=2508327 RepID=UPI0010700060|nr:hypothetical protein [Nocardioides sp. 1609]